MSNEETNNNQEELYSVAQSSKQFNIPENTIRKYITHFQLPTKKQGRKTYLTNEAVRFILEIARLRANGWSLKQILEFQQKSAQTSENPQETASDSREPQPSTASTETAGEEAHQSTKGKARNQQKAKESASGRRSKYSRKVSSAEEQSSEPSATQAEETSAVQSADPSEISAQSASRDSVTSESAMATESLGRTETTEAAKPSLPQPERERRRMNLDAHFIDAERFSQPLSREDINKEITTQARRVSRLQRFLGAKSSFREQVEIKSDLSRRYVYMAGLRYFRDNWLSKKTNSHYAEAEYNSRKNGQLEETNH